MTNKIHIEDKIADLWDVTARASVSAVKILTAALR